MELLGDYVLNVEFENLYKKYKEGGSPLHRKFIDANKPNFKLTIGRLVFIKKDNIHSRNKHFLSKCTELKYYYPSSELSETLGKYRDFLSYMRLESKKPIEFKKVGKYTLIKMTEEFVECIEKGLTPTAIDTRIEKDYKKTYKDCKIVDFYGITIVFY